jgi:hypothetical protein
MCGCHVGTGWLLRVAAGASWPPDPVCGAPLKLPFYATDRGALRT